MRPRPAATGSEAFVSAYCLLNRLGFLTVRVRLSRTQPEKKAASPRSRFLRRLPLHTVMPRAPRGHSEASERRSRDYQCPYESTHELTPLRIQLATCRR